MGKSAVVVGRSRGALVEYAEARSACLRFDYTIVVGKMIEDFPYPVDHAVSFHADLFVRWAAERDRRGYAPVANYWGAIYQGTRMYANKPCPSPLKYVDTVGGSSGFMALQVARNGLECDRVVLAGVPMMHSEGHHGSNEDWREADKYWRTWLEHEGWLLEFARSVSGRTRDLLGYPTSEWLGGRK